MADRAPERIWLRIRYGSILQYGLDGNFECGPADDRQIGTEYVRADLAPSPPAISGEEEELVKELAKARMLILLVALGDSTAAKDLQQRVDKAVSLIERQGREIATNIAVLEENVATMAEAKSVIERYRAELAEARAALETAIKVANEAQKEWDEAPEGMRAGKILIALAGHRPGYRADIDAIHASRNPADAQA